jgi:hypothetical protein
MSSRKHQSPVPRGRSRASLHLAHGLAWLTWLSASCTSNQKITQTGSDTYRIRCSTALSTCLEQAEYVCPQGFELREAKEERERHGVDVVGTGVDVERRSEGLIVCRSTALLDLRDPAPAPWNRERICTPGTTQECTGGGGCRGGQSCLLDASGFGPCDCVLGVPLPAASGDSGPTPSEPSSASSSAPAGSSSASVAPGGAASAGSPGPNETRAVPAATLPAPASSSTGAPPWR